MKIKQLLVQNKFCLISKRIAKRQTNIPVYMFYRDSKRLEEENGLMSEWTFFGQMKKIF
jgi:hypothetical protein